MGSAAQDGQVSVLCLVNKSGNFPGHGVWFQRWVHHPNRTHQVPWNSPGAFDGANQKEKVSFLWRLLRGKKLVFWSNERNALP